MREIAAAPLTAAAFAPFGDVIEAAGAPDRLINQGRCGRWHDLAQLDCDAEGRIGVSVFESEVAELPLTLEMVEQHPLGAQAFLPMTEHPFLVVVAPDVAGEPGEPLAFIAAPGQGVSYRAGTWHGVLAPLHAPGRFAVVDRIGPGPNLEEHWFEEPWLVRAA